MEESESTLGVLSGFVLGALTFQHLNTDSDTVSRARGCRPRRPCPRLPPSRAGSRTRAPSPALIRALWIGSGPGVKESSPRPPARRGHPAASRPPDPVLCEGSARRLPRAARVRERLDPGGRARAGWTRLPAAGSWPVRVRGLTVRLSGPAAFCAAFPYECKFVLDQICKCIFKLLPTFEVTLSKSEKKIASPFLKFRR